MRDGRARITERLLYSRPNRWAATPRVGQQTVSAKLQPSWGCILEKSSRRICRLTAAWYCGSFRVLAASRLQYKVSLESLDTSVSPSILSFPSLISPQWNPFKTAVLRHLVLSSCWQTSLEKQSSHLTLDTIQDIQVRPIPQSHDSRTHREWLPTRRPVFHKYVERDRDFSTSMQACGERYLLCWR